MDLIDLSDSEEEGNGLQEEAGVTDPRMLVELEDELQVIDSELQRLQSEIQQLCEEQEKLGARRAEIRKVLKVAASKPQRQAQANGQATCSRHDEGPNWSGAFDWDNTVDETRLNLFGLTTFRQHQREIINAILSGRDVFVIMPAGGGKSLCYQLPAVMCPGICLVVSPLLSLIQDQVMGLRALDIPANMLTSQTPKEEERAIHLALEKGEGELKLLYVTPEKIAKSKRFMAKLEKCSAAGRLSLIAIDEAHCCSQWGHDFRPDYKSLGVLKKQFPRVPLLALTATATERVQVDVREMLHMKRCEKFVSSVNRPNLYYEVREKKANASAAIDDIVTFIREECAPRDSGIIYCFSRRECEQVAAELSSRGLSAAFYHADMDAEARVRTHRSWSSNRVQLIVGTVAFGMGINKPDVRFVIHHSLSKSVETYYQESGRAGRDGLPARCLLFFRCADLARQSSMVFAEAAGLHNLYTIVRFCHFRNKCRRAAIFAHFNEPQQECHGMCDVCSRPITHETMDVTPHSRSLLAAVREVSGQENEARVTMLQLFDVWKKADPKLAKELGREAAERLTVQLLLDGCLREEFKHTAYSTNAYLVIANGARTVMDGRTHVHLQNIVANPAPATQGKGAKATRRQSGDGGIAGVRTAVERALDELRREVASEKRVFPHAVLSSEHMRALAAARPQTIIDLEAVIGKHKAKDLGERLLRAIEAPGSSVNGDGVGNWVSARRAAASAEEVEDTDKEGSRPQKKTGGTKRKVVRREGAKRKGKSRVVESDSEEDEDFVL